MHPVLSARLVEISLAPLAVENKTAAEIFGYTDAKKLCSSMTLFSAVSEADSVFHRVLERFYQGVRDKETLRRLG